MAQTQTLGEIEFVSRPNIWVIKCILRRGRLLLPVIRGVIYTVDWVSFCHSLQCWSNNQSCCNQMRFASIQCSKMRLPPGLCPSDPLDPVGGALPALLAGFKGMESEGGMEGKGMRWTGKEGRAGQGSWNSTADCLTPALFTETCLWTMKTQLCNSTQV